MKGRGLIAGELAKSFGLQDSSQGNSPRVSACKTIRRKAYAVSATFLLDVIAIRPSGIAIKKAETKSRIRTPIAYTSSMRILSSLIDGPGLQVKLGVESILTNELEREVSYADQRCAITIW